MSGDQNKITKKINKKWKRRNHPHKVYFDMKSNRYYVLYKNKKHYIDNTDKIPHKVK